MGFRVRRKTGMRKAYSKPDIAFESFSLTDGFANIASGGCAYMVSSHADGDCGYRFGERIVFLETIAGCKQEGAFVIEDGSPIADYRCYHVPTESLSLFSA